MNPTSASASKGRALAIIKPHTIKRSNCRQRMFKTKNLGPYVLMQTLGEGEYGKVKFAVHLESRQEVAVKLIRKESSEAQVRRSRIEREIHALKTLHHPNIIKLYDVMETENHFAVVLEYAPGGELFEFIRAHQTLQEEDAQCLFAQLISSVKYMHQKQIVHRDLKLENLLLDRNRNLMVTDFGFANCIDKDGLMATSCGSPCYAAPELVLNASRGRYAGPVADIWSCGVILYAMLCGHLPFGDDPNNPEGQNVGRLYRYILSTAPRFPSHVSFDATDLIRHMLMPDPTKRCTLEMVIRHPWLQSQAAMLSQSEKELEREAMAVKPVLLQTPASTTKGKKPENHPHKTKSLKSTWVNDTLPRFSRHSHRRGGTPIKSLFLPRIGSKQEPVAQAPSHTRTSSLRSRLKGSLRRPPNKKTAATDGLADDAMDEAVVLERAAEIVCSPETRRFSTLGRATRQHVVSQTSSPSSLPIIDKKKDPKVPLDVKQPLQTEKATRKKVKQWFKRIVQSEDAPTAQDEKKATRNTNVSIPPAKGNTTTTQASCDTKENHPPLRVYRGLVDQSALTSFSPTETMTKVRQILIELGIDCGPNSPGFKMECTRRHAKKANGSNIVSHPSPPNTTTTGWLVPATQLIVNDNNDGTTPSSHSVSTMASSSVPTRSESAITAAMEERDPIYGDPDMDTGEEVKFIVEICRLCNVPNLYIVHVRRLQGSAWAYTFVYRKLTGFLGILGLTLEDHSTGVGLPQL